MSTTDDVGPAHSQPGSGVAGLDSWSEGEIIGASDPNLSFGSGTTDGTFSSVVNFDLFAADADVDITALHHVIADITLTGPGILSGSIDLLAGDVLFITDAAETLNNAAVGMPPGWTNNIVTAAGDIYVFRAENTANYSSGYFRLVMTDPSVTRTTAITLVEKATTVGGDAPLATGDFLFVDSLQKNDIRWYDTATDTSVSLVSGVDIGISDAIYGLELAEVSADIAGVALDVGDILVTLDTADAAVGNNNLSVKEHDVVALKFTATTFGSGTAAATASLLFDGDGNANFDANKENIDALTLIFRGTGVNQAPVITLSGAPAIFVEDGSPVIIDGSITVTDADSPDFAGGLVSVDISAGGAVGDRLSIFHQGSGIGQIGIVGNDATYNFGAGAVIIGSFSGGLNSGSPLVVSLNANAELASTQALMRNITFWNTSDNPATAARTIDFVLTDGDGGTSNTITQTATVTVAADAPVALNDYSGLDFDGIDDHVSIADSASLRMTNTLTMEAWVKADASANVNRTIINKEGEYEVALFSDGTINWSFANTDPGWSTHNTGYVVADSVWTHIAVAYDNGSVSTYVNGSLVDVYNGSGAIGDADVTLDELRIGGHSSLPADKYFDGQIDDVRIWNTARTEAQIHALMGEALSGAEAGLAGYWNFNEGAGSSVADLTGNGNTGTLTDGGARHRRAAVDRLQHGPRYTDRY